MSVACFNEELVSHAPETHNERMEVPSCRALSTHDAVMSARTIYRAATAYALHYGVFFFILE